MTATVSPPPAAPPPPQPAPATRAPARPPVGRPAGPWVAELLLVGVTLVAVAGFTRLFADGAAVVPLAVAAVAAHLVGAGARRLGWGALPTAAVTAAAFVVQASVVLYPHTSAFGLPTAATLDTVGRDLQRAWELFGEVEAPAPRSRGFLLASTLTLWVAVGLADWAAFRLRAIAEAVLPAGALFVFTTLLGRGKGGVALTAVLVALVLAFAAAQRARRSSRDDAWVGGRAGAGARALGRTGVLVALAVALAGAVAGPRLPSADEEAVIDWRGRNGPDARTTVSPLVDIRARLVEQSAQTVFTVRAERGAYWRTTSLPDFDGQVWASSESLAEAGRDLPGEPPDATTEEVRQEFTIRSLGSIWAPAALTPVELVDSSQDLRWNDELATLIVPQDTTTIDGVTYTVVSMVPSFTPADLDAPQPEDLPDDVAAATELPAGLPAVVRASAEEAVAGAGPTPYDRALALQDWFRTGFVYDTEVSSGHGGNAIADFLRNRRGYCEQFAGTYAAMARTLGLPARVAVGFTPGERTDDGYTVRGRNAHAWPEVWLAGAGWVPFEPTPGRGMPGAERYTGVPPAQDEERADPTATEPAPTAPAPTTSPGSAPPTPTTSPPEAPSAEGVVGPQGAGDDGGTPWGWVLGGVLGAAVALVLLDVAVIAVVRRRRTARARAEDTVGGRVRRAWGRSLDALGLVGLAPAPSETAREFARRVGGDLGDAGPALTRLAGLVTATTWAPSARPPDPVLGRQADDLAHRVTDRIRATGGWKPRVRAVVDPRTLRAPRSARPGRSSGAARR